MIKEEKQKMTKKKLKIRNILVSFNFLFNT